VMFLNIFQVFLNCFKSRQVVLVEIRQGFGLIDEGIGFVLKGFRGSRFTIIGRKRGVGGNYLDKRRGIFNPVLSGEVGTSE